MIEIAIEHKALLFRIDAWACAAIAAVAIMMMQMVARVADRQSLIGAPWPRGLESGLRLAFLAIAIAAMLTVAEYIVGRVHFVLIEEVLLNVTLAILGVLVIAFRPTLFGRRV